MSFAYGFGLPHWQPLSGAFSPFSLFVGGVQGAWYDPSDLTTLFQDSAGTTPVTAVEQPVGLMLDKSKGLVLGSELVTNGDFSQGSTGWTAEPGWSISGGAASYSSPNTSGFGNLYQLQPVVAGQLYRFSLTVTNRSAAGRVAVRLGGSTFSPDITANGQFVCYLFAPSTGNLIVGLQHISGGSAGTVTITVDDFSVRALPGNHAYQTTSASRPTLRARYNLLTYSEQFSNAIYTAGSVYCTDNTAISPIGNQTAATFLAATGSANNYIYQTLSPTFAAATDAKLSWRVKANTLNFVGVTISNDTLTDWVAATFDLTNPTVASKTDNGASGTYVSSSISSLGNGWYEISITGRLTGAIKYAQIQLMPSATPTYGNYGNVAAWAAGSNKSIYIWGAQLVPTAVFPSNTYQRVGASTDYATGAAFPPYLAFDGVDDSLLTNSVDFTGTDKMLVVAGVTKSSDAALGMLAELSTDAASVAGSFYFAAPLSTGASGNYGFYSRGSVAPITGANSSALLAPRTSVLAALGDISGDSTILRVNGVQAASSTADQGTGNYGNYPLYIGRRNNASLPFNGSLFSLIIAGQSYSSGQISSTESWVAAKTPLGTI